VDLADEDSKVEWYSQRLFQTYTCGKGDNCFECHQEKISISAGQLIGKQNNSYI